MKALLSNPCHLRVFGGAERASLSGVEGVRAGAPEAKAANNLISEASSEGEALSTSS